MPDILIRMEMPKRCEDCMCYRREISHAYCTISSVNVLGHGNARLDNCPIVELPPHGDLIDRDALINVMSLSKDYHAQNCREETLLERFIRHVKEAHVIVPAEKGETQ